MFWVPAGSQPGLPWSSFLPQRAAEGVLRGKLRMVRASWGAAFGLLLFATALECRLKGKKWFVRLCHGYPGSRLLVGHAAGELASLFLPGLLGPADPGVNTRAGGGWVL